MLHKWKTILTNWINCYSDDGTKKEQCVTLDSLLKIISHLQNLSLDESKSSIIEAHTVEEFLIEKYPDFKLKNGTVEPNNQEEIYLAASLLLYFVCVNSKDKDIKTVMCSKLCGKDQEIILKYSKRLMECSAVTCRDVQAAIVEACGEETAAGESGTQCKVSETPPALRSLHGEVRRLQAALDAERFDRNYLQEELARTNFKIEKLSKDKDQCKLEIVGLKAKLSAVGQEVDDRSSDGGGEGPTQLAKQLEQLEERLVAAQEQLDEALYERDTYKARMDELKQDRDKWLSISQSEATRATQLSEQLETERSSNQSLKELVNELRQHNQRNCLDASQLECDDADASAMSLHNASVSSEACANVIEVQLGEEKAKVAVLKQQIQALQDQFNEITQKAQDEKQTLEKVLSEAENDVFELKHRINEEIEEKHLIKANYSDEICKLNNEITELEQKLKDTTEHSRQFIDQQLIDIKTLQEEKLSLIQSLNEQTTKLEQVICEVKNDLENEKTQKQNMKDDYENHMMKLKEKVLNRNNELVELQNNICQKSEMIEQLHLDLRTEKQNGEKLIELHNNEIAQFEDKLKTIENELKNKTNEASELQKRLNQNVAVFTEMNKDIDDLKLDYTELEHNYKCLNDEKSSLLTQLYERDAKIEELEKYNENLRNQYEAEKKNLVFTLDEKVATVNTLQMQLHAEIQYKSGLENELCHLRQARSSLSDEVNKLNNEISLIKSENLEKERTIYALDLYLKEEKHTTKTSKQECEKLNEEIKRISEELSQKENEMKDIVLTKESEIKQLEERLVSENTKLNEEIKRISEELSQKDNKTKEIVLTKESEIKQLEERLVSESTKLNEDIKRISEESSQKEDEMKEIVLTKESEIKKLEERLVSESTKLEEIKRISEELSQKENETKDIVLTKESEIKQLEERLVSESTKLNEDIKRISEESSQKEDEMKEIVLTKESEIKQLEERLVRESTKLNEEIKSISEELSQKDNEMKEIVLKLENELQEMVLKQESEIKDIVLKHETAIKDLEERLANESTKATEEIREKEDIIESTVTKLNTIIAEKENLESKLTILKEEKDKLVKDLTKKCSELSQLQEDLKQFNEVSENDIRAISKQLEEQSEKYQTLQQGFDTQTTNLMLKLNEKEKLFKELYSKSINTIKEKDMQVETMKIKVTALENIVRNERDTMSKLEKERDACKKQLEEEMFHKDKFEKEYQTLNNAFHNMSCDLNNTIAAKTQEVNSLKSEIDKLNRSIELKSEDNKTLEQKLTQESEAILILVDQKNSEVRNLKKEIVQLNTLNVDLQNSLKNEIETKIQAIESLQRENEQLHFTIEEDNSNHEVIVKEKDGMIERLEEHLKVMTLSLESIRKDYEDGTLIWEKAKIQYQEEIESRNDEIKNLNEKIKDLNISLEKSKSEFEEAKQKLIKQIEIIENSGNEVEVHLKEQLAAYLAELDQLKERLRELESAIENEKVTLVEEKESLIKEKESLIEELSDKESLYATIREEKSDLLNKNIIIIQELAEEKSMRQIAEQEKKVIEQERHVLQHEKQVIEQERQFLEQQKQVLIGEKEKIAIQLENEITNKNSLDKEKQIMSQQLFDERFKTKVLEKEKASLEEEVGRLLEGHFYYDDEEKKLRDEIATLNKTIDQLSVSKNQLHTENETLQNNNEMLLNNILELEAIKETILHDKGVLQINKEDLLKSLSEEKCIRDEIETEKNKLTDNLKELTEKYESDISQKLEQLQTMDLELKSMKTDFKKHEETNAQLTLALNIGLVKLLQNIKREAIGNEVLEKLVNSYENQSFDNLESKCDLLMKVADTLTTELVLRKNLEKALEHESSAVSDMRDMFKAKEMRVLELQTEVKTLMQSLHELNIEHSKQNEQLNSSLEAKTNHIQKLHAENLSLTNELNDVKVQLEVKVHSLKEKLVNNESITDKLKKSYECQIDNLNVMVTKLTNYLKEKSIEVDVTTKEKDRLQQIVDDSCKVIQSLHDEIRIERQNQEKVITDFESERLVLKNMITVTESVMEDQKDSLNKQINDQLMANEILQDEIKAVEIQMEAERKDAEQKIQEKEVAFTTAFDELTLVRKQMEIKEREARAEIQLLNNKIASLEDDILTKNGYIEAADTQNQKLKAQYDNLMRDLELQTKQYMTQIADLKEAIAEKESGLEIMEIQNNNLTDALGKLREDIHFLEKKDNDLQTKKESLEVELLGQLDKLTTVLKGEKYTQSSLHEKLQTKVEIQEKVKILGEEIIDLVKEKNEYILKMDDLKAEMEAKDMTYEEEIGRLKNENSQLSKAVEDNKAVITNLEQLLKHGLEESEKSLDNATNEKVTLQHKCSLLQEYQHKAEKLLGENDREMASLKSNFKTLESELEEKVKSLTSKLDLCQETLQQKEYVIAKIIHEKELIEKALVDEKASKERYENELVSKAATVYELGQKLEDMKHQVQILEVCKNENEEYIKGFGQRDACAVAVHEKLSSHKLDTEGSGHQVSLSTSDLGHSSMESLKTISDLEKIIHDKNRTITTLQSDITYMRSLVADSENKLLDVTNELELTKEHCDQLSIQLKKIHHQKNDEIADLKKQIAKMSVTENRATQIIKVSAKYQAIILKRIAEIKSNTILKELTNFGNAANCDSEVKRSLITGSITMEDLENFLETTDRHLKRCSDKQQALQKERDRLVEVNRINESEIINLKKFLTELSVSFKTFSSVKELYAQKLTKVVSVQRTVRREILNLDGHVTDVTMCRLERGYAAVMQDLSECAMNLERWVERCIGRTISPEKIKQAFTSDTERNSLATLSFQNAGLEVQLEELENSFQKLLEEVLRAQKGDGAKDPHAVTVMEVRAEYEDKLNRMKAKMKQLYQEQIAVFKEKQKDEIAVIEGELQKARDKLAESSRAYEEHIRHLTNELWSVGEKFLMKKDEAEWLRRKQKSGSLMSLQHVHSSGLMGHPEPPPRPSDTQSMRSLPVTINNANHPKERREEKDKRENRGFHMSDEEGEVFDNRCLRELSTPRREPPGARLSELRWRNSLCPPHLKSSYPAETQFAPVDEDEIKANASSSRARKEVGITAYKKPGPPTPSKQAGRLSATDSELRESLRVEGEPAPTHAHGMRKTSTPSRLRALFTRSQTNNANEGTPRRRLSHIFRKK